MINKPIITYNYALIKLEIMQVNKDLTLLSINYKIILMLKCLKSLDIVNNLYDADNIQSQS